ncbi:prepilin-type N-terminal cleavage/methylation domain-containing protein [Candidatus Saccharibacteria bacterium]|nr:prepilin-type N-terminal cleavage/methylation domain-containing protein [Candidatus Saccharibacteria bacterium]
MKNRSGFTVVELIAVIFVIGILMAVTFVSFNGAQGRSRDARRSTDIANIVKALELYYEDNRAYPDPNATASTINSNWYSSGDTSWDTFETQMVNAIDKLPIDPINSSGNPLNSGNYGYAYFTGSFCGQVSGQWYLLVYRFETATKERTQDGACTVNPLGDTYYDDGNSYHRVTR